MKRKPMTIAEYAMYKQAQERVGKGHGTNTPNLPVIRAVDPLTPAIQRLIDTGQVHPSLKQYRMGKVSILIHRDEAGYHLSLTGQTRYPTWDEVAKVRYELIPDECYMVMVLPPSSEYVNIHEFVFQLIEVSPDAIGRGINDN